MASHRNRGAEKSAPDHPGTAASGPVASPGRRETLDDLLNEAQALPQPSGGAWVVATRRLGALDSGPSGSVPAQAGASEPWLLVVLDAAGQVMLAQPETDPAPEHLAGALLLAMLAPLDGSAPRRPARLLSEDAALALSLHMALARIGISVGRQRIPGLRRALDEVVAGLRGPPEPHRQEPLPFLTGQPDEAVRALLRAFDRFMAAEPWKTFASDQLIHAAWETPEGDRGQLYATLLGGRGREFGLALYPDWMTYIRQMSPGQRPPEPADALEALTLSDLGLVHREDVAAMRQAGLGQAAPGLLRVGPQGVLPPVTPVRPLTAVLDLLSARAERSPAVTSLRARLDGVRLHYPAGPLDELSAAEQAGSVRVTLGLPPGEPGDELVFSAPARMRLKTALREIDEGLTAPGHPAGERGRRSWTGEGPLPDLTLAHLARLGHLPGLAVVLAEWQPLPLARLTVKADPEKHFPAGPVNG